jgi:putative endonuclease
MHHPATPAQSNVLPKTFYVYVLRSSKTGNRFVGSCENLEEGLRWHNTGHSTATRHGVPWIMVWSEVFSSKTDAISKERYYKTGPGRNVLNSFGL